jgi:hypothetical protein
MDGRHPPSRRVQNPAYRLAQPCGRGAAGSAAPSQGAGHGFEARRPLQAQATGRERSWRNQVYAYGPDPYARKGVRVRSSPSAPLAENAGRCSCLDAGGPGARATVQPEASRGCWPQLQRRRRARGRHPAAHAGAGPTEGSDLERWPGVAAQEPVANRTTPRRPRVRIPPVPQRRWHSAGQETPSRQYPRLACPIASHPGGFA